MLASRLRRQRLHGARLILLVVRTNFSARQLQMLALAWDEVIDVKEIQQKNENLNLEAKNANRFTSWHYAHSATFTKLQLWALDYDKVLYLDCDTLPRAPSGAQVTDLLALELLPGAVAAAPEAAWPDTFNTGVMVLKPDKGVYGEMLNLLSTLESYDGGDQGFLNGFFNPCPDWLANAIAQWTFSQPEVTPERAAASTGTIPTNGRDARLLSWVPIPYVYNAAAGASFRNYALDFYAAAAGSMADVRCIHYVGPHKPWHGLNNALDDEWWAAWHEHSDLSPDELTREKSPDERDFTIRVLEVPSEEKPEPHTEPIFATKLASQWTEELALPKDDHVPQQHHETTLTPADLCDPLKYIEEFGPTEETAAWDATREAPPLVTPDRSEDFELEMKQFKSTWDQPDETLDEPQRVIDEEVHHAPLHRYDPIETTPLYQQIHDDLEPDFHDPPQREAASFGGDAAVVEEPINAAKDGLFGVYHSQVAERVFNDRSDYTPLHSLLLKEKLKEEQIMRAIKAQDEEEDSDEEDDLNTDGKDEVEDEEEEFAQVEEGDSNHDEDVSTNIVPNLKPVFPWELRPDRVVERTFDF